jgi:predicted ester cyclase
MAVDHLHDTGTHAGLRWGIPATGKAISTEEFAFYRLHDGRFAEVCVTADDIHVLRHLQAGDRSGIL